MKNFLMFVRYIRLEMIDSPLFSIPGTQLPMGISLNLVVAYCLHGPEPISNLSLPVFYCYSQVSS